MEKLAWSLIGGIILTAIGSGIYESYKRAELEAGRKSGRYPQRWTDKNRWEKD